MKLDEEKIDEMVLALLYLTTFEDYGHKRTWKSYDWDAMDRLFKKGFISDPKSKTKSVVFSAEGARLSEELFKSHFSKS